jgi:peptide chain release factor 1
MYGRWAESAGLKWDLLDRREHGKGLRLGVYRLAGDGCERLIGEAGAHKVQRVTRSRNKDRIHTSTATLVCYRAPGPATAFALNPSDIRIDTFRGSGAGGQHRNVTDSAVRAVHIPSGEIATVTSGRSQHINRELALEVLAGRLAARESASRHDALQTARGQSTQAQRARAIRTYDEVRNVVRCSRTGQKIRDVAGVLDGKIDALLA